MNATKVTGVENTAVATNGAKLGTNGVPLGTALSAELVK